ncbi:hypothetical protein GQ43DRAFT_404803 [Delitschia confertaspora ATCC 74209]|uniref:Uncharacterized protein n=1 Tax=Delitschia confertaspora ATCC 74209 TaxID=1513339 RepID=A0A9P4JG16_9PLEO|nr:hypothetical protein GQ43DRAFT_404803 [Delitschia confertaspora ATCC 74209]
MTSKILVIGEVNGQFPHVFSKLADLQQKHQFAFALIVGNLFAHPLTATAEDEESIASLLNGKIHVPVTTYFALGTQPLPPAIISKLESAEEVCPNLYFLGKRTVMKTSEGIRIVALGGQLDANITAGASKDDYPPYYGETDAKILKGATTADILVTTEWPTGVRTRSAVPFNPTEQPLEQHCLADLCSALKPRYHFTTSLGAFYEREPFFHEKNEEGAYPITRFISLAEYGNDKNQKWIFAFSLDPKAALPANPPEGATASPLTTSDKKRGFPGNANSGAQYTYEHDKRPNKRRRGPHKAPSASECFFCLANENISTHLITSIGDNAYMTTAKGPLPTSTTFPKLGFPGHLLIIPMAHQPTLANMEEEERQNTYAEMQRYRCSLNNMLKSAAGEEYGSVTWEVSKSSLMHTHWQYMPVPAELIRNRSVEAAFKALAKNQNYPKFEEADVGDGFEETSDFFRVLIWDPRKQADQYQSFVLRFDEKIRFHLQFGREVMGKLLKLDQRVDWHSCGQTQQQEEEDVAKVKEAFAEFDFTE